MEASNDSVLRVCLPPPAQTSAKQRRRWRSTLNFGLLMLGGAIVGYYGARLGIGLLLPVPHKTYLLVGLAFVPLAWLVAVGVHELGHVVGGWLVGGRFLLWVVGPFMVRRTPTGIRFERNRSVNLGGGMSACLPLDPQTITPGRVVVMIAGGPIASGLLTIALLWLSVALMLPAQPPLWLVLCQHVTMITVGLSVLIFGFTVFPGSAAGFKTDGRRIIDLLQHDRRSDQEAALMALSTASLAGVRPTDYDPDLVRRAVALNDGSLFDLYGQLNAYYHAAYQGDWAAAQHYLDRVLVGEDKLAPFVRDTLRCEYAWLLARSASAPAEARAWLDTAGQLDFDPATRLRAEAAVLLAEGNHAEAEIKMQAGFTALAERSMSPVKNPFNLATLEAVRSALPQSGSG
jgi:hypothetical protein